ncbi:MAG: glycosyl hydrolase family 43, partial [Bacteroidota bacterium]
MQRKILNSLSVLLFFSMILFSCQQSVRNPFQENLEAGSINGSFHMPGYKVWGASVIRHEDGKYYMFVSIWPTTDSANWITHSQVALAISDKPEGPYQFEKIVLPFRERAYWDGMMSHNPTIHKHEDNYYLFYIGTTF